MIVKGTNKLPRAHIHMAECNHSVTNWNHVNFPRKVRPLKINYSKYPCSHSPETSPTENKLQQVFMLTFHCKVLPLKINYSMYPVLQDQHGSNVSPVVHSQLGTHRHQIDYSVVASVRIFSYKRYIRVDFNICGSLSNTEMTSLTEILRATLVWGIMALFLPNFLTPPVQKRVK